MPIFLLILSLYTCIDIAEFPQVFKHANIIHVHKKKEKSDKNNYRPISILPNVSKIDKKLICRDNLEFAKDIILNIVC